LLYVVREEGKKKISFVSLYNVYVGTIGDK